MTHSVVPVRWAIAVLSIGCLGVACGPQSPTDGREEGTLSTRSDRSGDDAVARCSLTRTATSPPDIDFVRVASLDIGSEGRVYVADQGAQRVVILSSDGRLLRSMGGAGEGPGEFQRIVNLQVLPGDSVLVYDKKLARLTVFAPGSDSVAYTLDVPSAAPIPTPVEMYQVEGSRLLAVMTRYVPASPGSPRGAPRRRVVHLLARDGSVTDDSLLVLAPATRHFVGRIALSGEPVSFSIDNPAARMGRVVPGPDRRRLYYGHGDSLVIEVYSLRGRLLRRISHPFEPVRFSQAQVDSVLNSLSGFWRRAKGQIERQIPDTWPAFQRFAVDDNHRVWVELVTAEADSTRWLVFESGGARLCTLNVPGDLTLGAVSEGRVSAIQKGPLGKARVVIYRFTVTGQGKTGSSS